MQMHGKSKDGSFDADLWIEVKSDVSILKQIQEDFSTVQQLSKAV